MRPQSWSARTWRRVRRTPRAVVVAWAVAAVVIVAAVGAAAFLPFGKPMTAEEKAKAIQDEYRRELKAGRPVTLVGETGLPRHHIWRLGSPELVQSWTGDGTCSFEAVEHALLELLDDPGIDSYSVRMQVRQLHARDRPPGTDPAKGTVGMYIGYVTTPIGGRGAMTTMLRTDYQDFDPKGLTNGFVTPRDAYACSFTLIDRPGAQPFESTTGIGRKIPFMPAFRPPGEWRTISYDVTADTIAPYWGDPPVAMHTSGGPAEDAHERYAKVQRAIDRQLPNQNVIAPAWSPRRPLGVFCVSSALSVRNVTVTPLTP